MTTLYSLTIFLSAFLLFFIQPMISKLLLPHLGGTPALWNTAMVFFQAMLLLGYGYAHLTVKWLGVKKQSALHIFVLLSALVWLPITAKTELGFTGVEHPISWVLLSLLLSVGVPFFVLAANAPLLQSWLSETNHQDAQNPYFLYSASNIGSLLALLSYPFVVEPLLSLSQQSRIWSLAFMLFIALLATCAAAARKHYLPVTREEKPAPPPSRNDRLYWIALAFFPSSLLLGVTTYITMDIASLPLFWVIPLAIYLLTFILAFARTPILVDWALKAQIVLVPLTALAIISRINHVTLILLLHLLAFFVLALGCHGTLARRKPNPKYLTEYYLWISFGGVLGGIFNALLAPQLFTAPIEYPLALGLALLFRPMLDRPVNPTRERNTDFIFPAIILLLLAAAAYANRLGAGDWIKAHLASELAFDSAAVLLCVAITTLAAATSRRPVRFALSFLVLLLVVPLVTSRPGLIYTERNFFGVNRVYHQDKEEAMLLMHGTTVHGKQSLRKGDRLHLTTYYAILREVHGQLSPPVKNMPIAALGLGAGTVACLGADYQPFDFYEIDPAIAGIATNHSLFTYISDCGPKVAIHLGDGRLEIAKAADKRYGFIVIDTFSSDAIPVHIITRQALAIYKNKLADGGMLAFNISNRHLNLMPLLAAMAEDAGLAALVKKDLHPSGRLMTPSVWVLMARQEKDFNGLEASGWILLKNDSHFQVWTDDYSNIFQTLF